MEKLLALSNFFFCRHVFKKLSAAEASQRVYMRERVNAFTSEFHKVDSSVLKIEQFHFPSNKKFSKIECLCGKQCIFQERLLVTSCLSCICIVFKSLQLPLAG